VGATVGGGGTWFSGTYTYGPNIAAGGASTVAGGFANRIDAGGTFGIIGGGSMNRITAAAGVDIKFATVGGGTNNTVGRGGATVAGGNSNQATGFDASVGGGNGNVASGGAATVPGGGANTAQGKYSFAAGRRTKAVADGAVLFSDSTDADFTGTFPNVFAVGFTGGIGMWTSKTFATGCSIPAGGGAWSCTSSRDQKQDFAAVDAQDVLQRVAALPITEWRYRTEASGARHMGPTAQDFHTAFELGDSETSIGLIDAAGIALAAIQGVNAKLEEQLAVKGAEIDSLKAEVAELKRAVEVLLTRTSPEGRVTERR